MKVENSAGLSCTSGSSSTLTSPRPSRSTCSRSCEIELGLAEERERALLLQLDHLAQQHADGRLRHAAVVLQVGRAGAGQVLQHRAQVGEVEQLAGCWSSQYLKTSASTLAWVSFRSSTFASSSGPNDDTVARSCAPRVAGEAQELDRERRRRPRPAGLASRAAAPCRSARPARRGRRGRPSCRRGTPGRPAAESCSAMSCSVLVLPVPVAPAIRPWRFIIASGTRTSGSGAHSFPDMGAPRVRAGPVLSNAARHAASSFASMEGDPSSRSVRLAAP